MAEYAVTYAGQITQDGRAVSCPGCDRTRGLTICGHLGSEGYLRCTCGAQFKFPPGFNPAGRLRQAAADLENSRRGR